MIAIVTILLVAILVTRQHNSLTRRDSPKTRKIPSCHSSQCLITPVRVALALQERASSVLNSLALACKVRKRVATDIFSLERYALALP